MTCRALFLPAVLLPLVAAPALAQSGPAHLRPTRDVSVTYGIDAPGEPAGQWIRMSWLAAEDKVRVEPEGAPGWLLLDRRQGQGMMVMDSQRRAMRLPPDAAAQTRDFPEGASFKRVGGATIAGQGCTEWRVSLPSGQGESTSCITEDGVLLRTVTSVARGRTSKLEAREVSYAAQDPARFRVPEGYTVMQPGSDPLAPPSR